MSTKEKVTGVRIRIKDYGADGCELLEVCREISVKEMTEDCERTALYPEENCGQPTTFVVCEEVSLDDAVRSSKNKLTESGL